MKNRIHIRRIHPRKKALGSLPDFDAIVQKALDDKQKSKTFKDVGDRVGGSRKERAAYQTISFTDLAQIELDSVQAAKLVTKEKVFPLIDVADERERGVSAGAAYLKVEIRKSCAAKPPNDKVKRAGYVRFVTRLSADFADCFTIDDIERLLNSYLKWTELEAINYLIDPDLNITQEQAKGVFDKAFPSYYARGSVIRKVMVELLGKTCYNVLYKGSEAGAQTWNEALQFERFSEEKSKVLIETYQASKQKFIDKNQQEAEAALDADVDYLKKKLDSFSNVGQYKKDLPAFRKFLIGYYEKRVLAGKKEYENPPKLYLAREDDWSWADLPKNAKAEGEKFTERQINKGIPLAYIKRVGGLKIEDDMLEIAANTDPESNPITSVFGFKSVQFGNYVKDNEAKENVRHFLGAITDLAEVLNVDLKQINKIGGLSIAFGARGKGKASAHYEAGYKIINLTKGNGDGSLAHEWAHYLDNILTMLGGSETKIGFGTDFQQTKYGYRQQKSEVKNEAVNDALFKIMTYIFRGNEYEEAPVTVRFFAIESKFKYSIRVRGEGYVEVTPKGNANETFDFWSSKDTYFSRVQLGSERDKQIKIIGKLVADLGLPYYDLPLTLKGRSTYHYYSSLMSSEYWIRPWELFARAWETYIFDKLASKGKYNNYLVSEKYFLPAATVSGPVYLYPTGPERKYLFKLYDSLIETMKAEYFIRDFKPFTDVREDEYLELDADDGSDVSVTVATTPVNATDQNGGASDRERRKKLMVMKAKALELELELLSF